MGMNADKISVTLETAITRDFAVDQVAALFDVPLETKSRRQFAVELPAMDDDWTIGAIVGPSGSGKSSVARQWCQQHGIPFIEPGAFDWPADKAVVSCFEQPTKTVHAALNAVGFSEPPAWVLPYHALSTGQRMRCDLARALLLGGDKKHPGAGAVAFDEFTSVVDRQVAQFASAAVTKAVRSARLEGAVRRFVAVTCHYDVLDWLQADWVLDMATCELARGCLRQRPTITLEVHRVSGKVRRRQGGKTIRGSAGRALWRLFKHHHYLTGVLHQGARVYAALWNKRPVAFLATLANAGFPRRRIVHRLVVLPDFQGLGIGLRLLDTVAQLETDAGHSVSIRTSHPALINALRHRPTCSTGNFRGWKCIDVTRKGKAQSGIKYAKGGRGGEGRAMVSFRYEPPGTTVPARPRQKGLRRRARSLQPGRKRARR